MKAFGALAAAQLALLPLSGEITVPHMWSAL